MPALRIAVVQVSLREKPRDPVNPRLGKAEAVALLPSLPLAVPEPDPGLLPGPRCLRLDLDGAEEDAEERPHLLVTIQDHQLRGALARLAPDVVRLLAGEIRAGVRLPVRLPPGDELGEVIRRPGRRLAQGYPRHGLAARLRPPVRALRQVVHARGVAVRGHADRQGL